jgi:histidinol phosphatase-like enzyme (inositol monophosphatase family)
VSVSLREYLDFAMDAAWRAGQLALGHFQTGVAVERKADHSPVTVADRGAEELLRALIKERFPDHAVLGEELGEGDTDSSHRWILDPIDGTQAFVHGVPLFGVLVGLEIAGEMVVGVCHLPALRETVAAALGEGCRWNGRRARVSPLRRLDQALVAYTDAATLVGHPSGAWGRLLAATRMQRGWSDCYAYCLVATGRADVAIDALMSPWDCAALVPILREAGGTFTDWNGQTRIDGGQAVATNGVLFEPVMRLLKGD